MTTTTDKPGSTNLALWNTEQQHLPFDNRPSTQHVSEKR